MTLVTEIHYTDCQSQLFGPFDNAVDATKFGERIKNNGPNVLDYYIRVIGTPLDELLRLKVPNEPMRKS